MVTALSATAVRAAEPTDVPGDAALQSTPATQEETASEPAKDALDNDKLGENDRELLADAVAAGDRTVTLILATERGATAAVQSELRGLGATIGYVDDELGYVRATLPTGKVASATDVGEVLKVDLNTVIEQPDPRIGVDTPDPDTRPGAGAQAERRRGKQAPDPDGPGPQTPAVNPYLPTEDLGSERFKRDHPTWDGRGTTIGILDSGVDLDHPALQTTTTGERKIVDWITATDPLLEGDGSWREMRTSVTGPAFTYADQPWIAPAGSFFVDRFSESITGPSEPGGDINRDGDTTDTFGILYDPTTNDIWVDSDQDGDFTDAPAMRPYREQFQVGHFGTDDLATSLQESIPFVVEFREDVDLTPAGLPGQTADFVNIGLVESAHGTHVAGITAAHQMFGGAMQGQAPGAKLVSSRACSWGGGCTAVALTEGMIDLVANRGVDVVNMSIGGLPALNDGANARAELYDRLIDTYGVQLFISAGNSGPGLNTVGDPSVATDVVSVGSSITRETWLANYGSSVKTRLAMHNFSSRGPREDGGFKPNVTGPGSAVSTVPQWLKQPDLVETGYQLPIGYAMFNGTSMASPQVAGASALLLSATKARGIPVTPPQLRAALYSTADQIQDVPAYAQGVGQVDVRAAWKLVRQRPEVRDYVVSAPVCTEISDFLVTPDAGTGIYNRCAAGAGGHAPDESKDYAVTITRTSGPSGSARHDLSWAGNDGTFRAPRRVDLPLGKPVTVTISAQPGPGAHGAVLLVDDRRTPAVDHQVLNTVVAGTELSGPTFATGSAGEVDRNGTESVFVTVPVGAKALQVDLAGIATGSQTRFIAFNPYGVPVESTSSLTCFTNRPSACDPVSRAYENPLPGVWEIEVEARRTSPFLENPYRLSAAVQGVTVEPAEIVLPSATAGVGVPVSWTVTNAFGTTDVTAEGGPLGSASNRRLSIGQGEVQTYEVVVPAGASRFDVSIGAPSDLAADLDLYVYRGTTLVGQSADGDSDEAVSLANPVPGTYTVEVDGYSVPAGTTEYDYRDVFFASSLGQLAVDGSTRRLAAGESTTVDGVFTPLADAAPGRQLFGEMVVRSAKGAVLGRGAVLVADAGGTPAP